MKNKNIVLSLIIFILILTLFIFTENGYAIDNNIPYTNETKITYLNHSEFDVSFNKNSNLISNDFIITGPKSVVLKDINLTKVNESKKVLIPIINNSQNISAKLSPIISNNNTKYFEVNYNLSKSLLHPQSDEAIIEINVTLKKLPTQFTENAKISIDIDASPIY